jgi:hypothetical protein
MNSLIKLTVAALAIATLSGCGVTIREAPKNAQELAALGDDNLLNVPVDITGFSWKKQEIVAVNGDKGIVTVFTDPKTGLTYDLDGQPVNTKAERVLKNGYVCEVKSTIFNRRVYESVEMNGWCNSNALNEKLKYGGVTPKGVAIALTGGMALVGAGVGIAAASAAGGVYAPLIDAATNDTSGDTL